MGIIFFFLFLKMPSVLFVCLGNICRSTMAESIFRKMIKDDSSLSGWEVDSAGTASYHVGDSRDRRGMQCVRKRLYDSSTPDDEINPHRARQAKKKDFDEFDYIFCMDHENFEDMKRIEPKNKENRAKLLMLGKFDPEGKMEIDDPYYGGKNGFENNFDHITP